MDRSKELLLNSLNYYDHNTEKYQKIFKKFKYYTFTLSNNDLEHSIIIFYDKNKNQVFKSRFERVGLYNIAASSWTWSWSIARYTKNSIQLAKKVLVYGLDLNVEEVGFLKEELITSRFKISDTIQLEIHAAIASYLTKKPMIFKLINDPINELEHENMYKILYDVSQTSNIVYLYLLDENGLN